MVICPKLTLFKEISIREITKWVKIKKDQRISLISFKAKIGWTVAFTTKTKRKLINEEKYLKRKIIINGRNVEKTKRRISREIKKINIEKQEEN